MESKALVLAMGAAVLIFAGYWISSGNSPENGSRILEPAPAPSYGRSGGQTGEATDPWEKTSVPKVSSGNAKTDWKREAAPAFEKFPGKQTFASGGAPLENPSVSAGPAPVSSWAGDRGYVVPRRIAPSGKVSPDSAELPLVLYETPPELNLTKMQEEQLAQLAADFISKTGANRPNQNAEDPQFAARWKEEQFLSDEILRATIGWEAFNRLKDDVYQASR